VKLLQSAHRCRTSKSTPPQQTKAPPLCLFFSPPPSTNTFTQPPMYSSTRLDPTTISLTAIFTATTSTATMPGTLPRVLSFSARRRATGKHVPVPLRFITSVAADAGAYADSCDDTPRAAETVLTALRATHRGAEAVSAIEIAPDTDDVPADAEVVLAVTRVVLAAADAVNAAAEGVPIAVSRIPPAQRLNTKVAPPPGLGYAGEVSDYALAFNKWRLGFGPMPTIAA